MLFPTALCRVLVLATLGLCSVTHAAELAFYRIRENPVKLRTLVLDANGVGSMALEKHLGGLVVHARLRNGSVELTYARDDGQTVVFKTSVLLGKSFHIPPGVEPPAGSRQEKTDGTYRLEIVPGK